MLLHNHAAFAFERGGQVGQKVALGHPRGQHIGGNEGNTPQKYDYGNQLEEDSGGHSGSSH